MRFYRLMGSDFQILDGEKITHVPLPGPLAPGVYAHLVGGERYAAIGNSRATAEGLRYVPEEAHGLWLYDQQEGQLLTVPIKVTKEDCFTADSIMGPGNTLYFSDGNSFWRWRLGERQGEKLVRFQQAKGAPMGLGISPEGRYLSYYKYRSENKVLHLYDLDTGEVRDTKCSIFHYHWLDETSVVYTKSSGVKALDIKTGRCTTILRGYRDILRWGSAPDILAPFEREKEVWEEMDLLGISGGRLWFSLRLCCPREAALRSGSEREPFHHGIWSSAVNGSQPRLHFECPQISSSSSGPVWTGDCLTWSDSAGAYLYDGRQLREFFGWKPLVGYPDF